MNWGKVGLFAGGVLFGTAGIKIPTSRDAKKVYAFTTAAALRAKEAVMTTATNIREGADDILADAVVSIWSSRACRCSKRTFWRRICEILPALPM